MICLPTPDAGVLERREAIVAALRGLVPADNVVAEPLRLAAYETDALTAYRQRPLAVVLPETTAEVAAVLRFAAAEGVRIVPRGAGTSLSGGAIPAEDAIVLALAKFNRILEIDYANRCVVAQCGVTNLAVSYAVAERGFYYAPDPSSQIACTIGGNVAENSGGVHCLKYGLTTNNVLGVELVTPDGEVLRLGGRHLDSAHYDLLGLTVGSEGLIGVVTEVTVRICGARKRRARYSSASPCSRMQVRPWPPSSARASCRPAWSSWIGSRSMRPKPSSAPAIRSTLRRS